MSSSVSCSSFLSWLTTCSCMLTSCSWRSAIPAVSCLAISTTSRLLTYTHAESLSLLPFYYRAKTVQTTCCARVLLKFPMLNSSFKAFKQTLLGEDVMLMGSPLCALDGGIAITAGDANMDHLVSNNCQPGLTHSWTEDESRTRAKHSSKDQDEMGWLVVNRPQDLYTELLFGNLSADQKVVITVDLYLTSDCQIDQRFLRRVATHSSSKPVEISTGHLTTATSRAWILAFLRDMTLCVLMYLAAVIAILTGPLNGTTSPCSNLHDLHSNFRLCRNHILTWPQSSLISK